MISMGQGAVYAMAHGLEPWRSAPPGTLAAILCPPIADELATTQRILFHLGEALARQGHLAVRVDYLGNGESDGAFEDCHVETCVHSVSAVASWLSRHHITSLVLVGVRMGALFAAIAARRLPHIAGLVLIDPVTKPGQYVKELEVSAAIAQRMSRESRQRGDPDDDDLEAADYCFSRPFLRELQAFADGIHAQPGCHRLTITTGRSARASDTYTKRESRHIPINEWRYWAKRDVYRLLPVENAVLQWMRGLRVRGGAMCRGR